MKRTSLVCVGILLAIACAGECALIEVEFSGNVNYVADSAYLSDELPIIAIGDTFSGILRYDSSAEDQDESLHAGIYTYDIAPNGISIEINDYVFKTDPESVDLGITIVHGGPIVEPYDAWAAYSLNNLPILETVIIGGINIEAGGGYGKLDSDALLTTEDQFIGWNYANLRVRIVENDLWSLYFRGDITSISLVPEPGTIVLLGLGSIGLICGKRDREGK